MELVSPDEIVRKTELVIYQSPETVVPKATEILTAVLYFFLWRIDSSMLSQIEFLL